MTPGLPAAGSQNLPLVRTDFNLPKRRVNHRDEFFEVMTEIITLYHDLDIVFWHI